MPGWVIAVLTEASDGPELRRLFFAVGFADQGQAEWKAVDAAAAEAPLAPGPRGGLEPVQALSSLTDIAMRRKGLLAGEVRPLGEAWPRNWL
ncbi:MAG: hypothetical protein IM624_01915 [Phenylobacterium sp.]|jgi:hypothetical protein|uniref:hypothetical protein n=1 Tax=Phenylobacterium sp. TaxID=1871053 RepID=UPI0025EAA9FF|nr:hypothetical protein [Phenylobacterium sp.]MCA6296334.1 hypothetical protein [Phenylobacterium sp.]MCA6297936.1 hypothetical protein [Phenylobacterium sp.]